jgi:osmotically inducible protein OsmC
MEKQRTATAVWHGDNMTGHELVTTESGGLRDLRLTRGQRFADEEGPNPEELLAAAHASCFSMALAGSLTRAGFPPDEIRTTAAVTLRKDEAGFSISRVHLTTEARVPGLDEAGFLEAAEGAKTGCPISRLLAPGLESLTMDATLRAPA